MDDPAAFTPDWRAIERSLALKTTGSQPKGYTALHFLCDGSSKHFSNASHVAALLRYKAPIEARDANGNTPFLLAVGTGLTDVARILIQNECDMEATNARGMGAWQRAKRSSPDMARMLEEHGAVANFDSYSVRSGEELRSAASVSRGLRYIASTAWTEGSPYGRHGSASLFSRRHSAKGEEDYGKGKGKSQGKGHDQRQGKGEFQWGS